MWITTGKFLDKWEYQNTFTVSLKMCTKVEKQQLEPNVKQWTGSKLRKAYVKAVYCHPAYFTYMQSASCEMLGWMNHKLNQDCQEKYQQPQIC